MQSDMPTASSAKASDGYSAESYITIAKAKDLVSVLRQLLQKTVQQAAADEPASKKAKRLPLGDEKDADAGPVSGSVRMEILLKKIPLNKTTYINVIGPLPHPWKYESADIDVCLIVKDLDPRKSLPDRELDLETTRAHYREKLADAGFSEDFLTHRLMILPMRELLTEFKEREAKGRLAAAYHVFLADRRLMANKFSGLKTFLGKQFWIDKKRVPLPIDLKQEGSSLKQEVLRGLDSTDLYVSGRGSSETIEVGLLSQTDAELAYNLMFVLQRVRQTFGPNVSCLRLGVSSISGSSSSDSQSYLIPFFVDMDSANELTNEQICPRTRALNGMNPFEVAGK